jgi:hypothetical protein
MLSVIVMSVVAPLVGSIKLFCERQDILQNDILQNDTLQIEMKQ